MHAWVTELGEDLRIARFRDNIFCFCPLDQVATRMVTTKRKLELIYELTLDYEQAGRALTFWEVQLI